MEKRPIKRGVTCFPGRRRDGPFDGSRHRSCRLHAFHHVHYNRKPSSPPLHNNNNNNVPKTTASTSSLTTSRPPTFQSPTFLVTPEVSPSSAACEIESPSDSFPLGDRRPPEPNRAHTGRETEKNRVINKNRGTSRALFNVELVPLRIL